MLALHHLVQHNRTVNISESFPLSGTVHDLLHIQEVSTKEHVDSVQVEFKELADASPHLRHN